MPRDSGRRRNRHRRSSRDEVDEFEEAQRKVRELEEKLQKKNESLAQKAKRLEENYGYNVDLNIGNYSSPDQNNLYMSPIRIGVSDDRSRSSSPIVVAASDPYRASPLQQQFRFDHNQVPNSYPFERPPFSYVLEPPPGYKSYELQSAPYFRDDQEVRVDEMPRWPMHDLPAANNNDILEQPRAFSPTPVWRHQYDVQVEPMPVFPMGDDEELKDPGQMQRDERARLQMEMIAKQAQAAEVKQRPSRSYERSNSEERRKEREEKRKARHEIEKYRDKAIQEVRAQDREKDMKRREEERNRRHALRRKQEEEEDSKKRAARRKEEENAKQYEAEEFFLRYLIPAIGNMECKSQRIEGKSPAEYITVCHAVNIPTELLKGSKISDNKGDSYKGSLSNYVEKLVGLGVIKSETRNLLKRIEKLPQFLAELVEPLCNDIAIYGTQISVTEERDIRSKFDAFSKEKSAEFWSSKENKEKLDNFLKRYDRKRNPLRPRSKSPRDRKRYRDRSRRRSTSRERSQKSPSPSNPESLKTLFANVGTNPTALNLNQATSSPTNGYMTPQQQPGPPSLLSFPLLPPPQPMMNPYMPPPLVSYPPHPPPQFQLMNGYGQYNQQQQQPMMQQQPPQLFTNNSQPQIAPMFPQNFSQRDDDAALMDEIFT